MSGTVLISFLCYCGNSLAAGSVNQTSSDPKVNGCNMICAGNQLEYCGGPSRLDLYALNGTAVVTTTTSTVSSPTSTTSSSSTAAPTPTTVTSLSGYTYLGCYSEATANRALSGDLLPIPAANNSVEACAAACSTYTYFGVEYCKLLP